MSLLPRPDPPKSGLTALSFEVADLEAEIGALERCGVRFEDYELPGLKTVNHVFTNEGEGEKCAWFTGSEDNALCIHQTLAH